jgi:hypothetical protein
VLGLQETISSVTEIRNQFEITATKKFQEKYKKTLLSNDDIYVSED